MASIPECEVVSIVEAPGFYTGPKASSQRDCDLHRVKGNKDSPGETVTRTGSLLKPGAGNILGKFKKQQGATVAAVRVE